MFYNRTFVYGCKPNLERLYSILANLSCSASVVHLACISVDRFIAVACVSSAPQNRYEEMWVKDYVDIILGIPYFSAHSNGCSPTFLSQSVLGDCVVCLPLFCCHLLIPFDYGVLAHPPEKKEEAAGSGSFCWCTLAIVIGVFTACWVQKWPHCLLPVNHWWRETALYTCGPGPWLFRTQPWIFWFTLQESVTLKTHTQLSLERCAVCRVCCEPCW